MKVTVMQIVLVLLEIVLLMAMLLFLFKEEDTYDTLTLTLELEESYILDINNCAQPSYVVSNPDVLSVDSNGKVITTSSGPITLSQEVLIILK